VRMIERCWDRSNALNHPCEAKSAIIIPTPLNV
jgi:hypothetical protein